MEITDAEAASMTRAQALRALATADGVPEKDRRMAQLMLAGPEITSADMGKARPRLPLMRVAVHAALGQLSFEIAEQRRADIAAFRELGGFGQRMVF